MGIGYLAGSMSRQANARYHAAVLLNIHREVLLFVVPASWKFLHGLLAILPLHYFDVVRIMKVLYGIA